HPFVTRPAVDHRRRRSTLRAQIGPQLCRRRRVEIIAVGGRAGAQHDAIIIPRRLLRHAALGHIARDQLRLALERITPAAAARRRPPPPPPGGAPGAPPRARGGRPPPSGGPGAEKRPPPPPAVGRGSTGPVPGRRGRWCGNPPPRGSASRTPACPAACRRRR